MGRKKKYSFFVLFFMFFVFPAVVYSYTKTYNMHAFDLKSLLYMNLKVSYTDNQTEETTDNETMAGKLEFTVFDRTFESSEGVYVQTGEAFNGSWSATEKKYSSYYETDLHTFFNYSIYGVFLFNEFLSTGVFYGEQVTKKKDGTILEDFFYAGPFIGIIVSVLE